MKFTSTMVLATALSLFAWPAAAQSGSQDAAAFVAACGKHANAGRLDEYIGCWADDATNNGRPMRKDMIKTIMADIRRTFPDYHSEVLETITRGDTVVTLSRVSGTHLGVGQTNANGGLLKGAKPTGKRFEVLQTHWWKVKDGKLVFHRGVRDDLGMMQQLGLLPEELPAALIQDGS